MINCNISLLAKGLEYDQNLLIKGYSKNKKNTLHVHNTNTTFNAVTFEQKHLKEKINELEASMSSQSEENKGAVDDLHKLLQQVKSELHISEEQCNKLKGAVDEQGDKLTNANEKINGLEATVTSKVSLI